MKQNTSGSANRLRGKRAHLLEPTDSTPFEEFVLIQRQRSPARAKLIVDLLDGMPKPQKMIVLENLLCSTNLSKRDINSKLVKSARRRLLRIMPGNSMDLAEELMSAAMKTAEEILSSLQVKPGGSAKLIIPANVSDIEAMRALNVYFRKTLPDFSREVINDAVNSFIRQPDVTRRDVSKERKIEIIPLVNGTLGLNAVEQEAILKSQGLTFAAPANVALVVAAYAFTSPSALIYSKVSL